MAERSIAAYVYLHDTQGSQRVERARKHGLIIKDETAGSGRVLDPQGFINKWTDRDPATLDLQMKDAKTHGIDVLLTCAYAGQVNSKDATENREVLDIFAKQAIKNEMKYALMLSMRLPPNRIPYQPGAEPDRDFDCTENTLLTMMDFAREHWHNSQYFNIDSSKVMSSDEIVRPFVMVYGLTPRVIEKFRNKGVNKIGISLQKYGQREHLIAPYLVAVVDSPDMAVDLREQGFDAVTTYAGLPSFNERIRGGNFDVFTTQSETSSTQKYYDQLKLQMNFWMSLLVGGGQRFYPSAVSGWDPILRCDSKIKPEAFPQEYPYSPRILDSTPDKFLNMMLAVYTYYQLLPWRYDPFPYIICSLNDVGDGTDILRRLRPDGSIDDGYLQAVKTFYDFIHSPYPIVFLQALASEKKIDPRVISLVNGILKKKH